jgi:cytochrome P450
VRVLIGPARRRNVDDDQDSVPEERPEGEGDVTDDRAHVLGGSLPVDLGSPSFLRNPYPYYRLLREEAPVYRQPQGAWLLTRHRDCVAALEDDRFVNVQEVRCYPDGVEGGVAAENGYTRMRKAAAQALAPSRMRDFETGLRRRAEEMIDAAVAAGDVDLVEYLAYPLPAAVFCDLFGLPAADISVFRDWVDDLVHGVDLLILDSAEVAARSHAAQMEFSAYLWRFIEERRRQPTNDLLSSVVQIQRNGKALTDGELLAFCITFFIAGHAATSSFIPLAVKALLENPAELERFRASGGDDRNAIEELMRYASPTHFTMRSALTDVEFAGHHIRKGDIVGCVIGSANRDPEVFSDPERLDLSRRSNPHVVFGHGIHFCLGMHLARLEARIVLSTLLRKAPSVRLRGESSYKGAVWLRGLNTLPVSLR